MNIFTLQQAGAKEERAAGRVMKSSGRGVYAGNRPV
jgi:hypothetical protein